MDEKLLVLLYQHIRSHVLIRIFLPSKFQMEQGMSCNKDGTTRQRSSSRIWSIRRTIFSAQLGAARIRFAFWVRIKWGILRVWLWKDILRKKKKWETIAGPRAERYYMTYFNAFDKNDHDISFYLMTIRTTRYYLRIFFWAMDRVVHNIIVVVC